MKPFLALAGLVALSACGSSSPQDNAAERLDRAAEQSDPAAAEVLHNKADAIRENEAGDPGAAAQNALSEAGNAQAPAVQPSSQDQARPHRAGEPMPPAQTR